MNVKLMRRIDGLVGNLLCTALAAGKELSRPFAAPPGQVKNIVVMKFFGMGSIIVASRSLAALRHQYPDAEIHFVTFKSNKAILDILGMTDHDHYVDPWLTIALDDFGTGYSSLSVLQRFPVDKIKIDRAFVKHIGRNAQSGAIIRAIVNLGHGLDVPIVAEGVETAEQRAFLIDARCDQLQGFLIGKPEPIIHYAEIVGREKPVDQPKPVVQPMPAARVG